VTTISSSFRITVPLLTNTSTDNYEHQRSGSELQSCMKGDMQYPENIIQRIKGYSTRIFDKLQPKMEKELLQGCWIEDERDGDMKREQQISHLKEAPARGEDWIGEAVKTRIFDIYQEGPWNLKGDLISTQSAQEFRRLSTNIRQFCNGVGYPALCFDPLDNVNALYEYLTSRKFWRHELQSKLEELQKSHYEQKRIIVSLSYRHLMEQLPLRTEGGEPKEGEPKGTETKIGETKEGGPKDREPQTETKRWEKF
jgi:hypothetical protein